MDSLWRCLAALLLSVSVTGCNKPVEPAEIILPAVVAVREQVQQIVPLAPPDRPEPAATPDEAQVVPPPPDVSLALATKLIVRWEVSSPATYERKYQGVVCPPSPSGPTFGVGYDGGTQTADGIALDWATHPQVDDLVTTAGQMGSRCRPAKARLTHVRTPYALAYGVFSASTLPGYVAAARRALGPVLEDQTDEVKAALYDLGYNRGWSMLGPRRAEMVTIRDVCLPAYDGECVGVQLRKMCRLWPDTPGLCNRRIDEAELAEKT